MLQHSLSIINGVWSSWFRLIHLRTIYDSSSRIVEYISVIEAEWSLWFGLTCELFHPLQFVIELDLTSFGRCKDLSSSAWGFWKYLVMSSCQGPWGLQCIRNMDELCIIDAIVDVFLHPLLRSFFFSHFIYLYRLWERWWFLLNITYRTGAFLFVTMNVVFSNISALELFIKERALFMYVSGPIIV